MSQKISAFNSIQTTNEVKQVEVAGIYRPSTNGIYNNVKIKLVDFFYTKEEVLNEINKRINASAVTLDKLKVLITNKDGLINSSSVGSSELENHIADAKSSSPTNHVSSAEKTKWNNHVSNKNIHITSDERTKWDSHVDNKTIHITAAERTKWNQAKTTPFLDYENGKTIIWDTAYNRKYTAAAFNPKWANLKEGTYAPWSGGIASASWSAGNDLHVWPFYAKQANGFTFDKGSLRQSCIIPALSTDSLYIIELAEGADYAHNDETFRIDWRENSSSDWKYIGSYSANGLNRLHLPMEANSQIKLTLIITDSASAKIIAFPYKSST